MTVREMTAEPKLTTAGCGEMPIRDTDGKSSRVEKAKELVRDQLNRPWDWNKIGIVGGAVAAVAGAAYAASKLGSSGQDDFELRLETDENVRLISSKKVEGTPVYGSGESRIGTVDNFMVDKYTGRVAYAVMRFGGTFGFGESLFPLPWAMLDYDEELGGYRLEIEKSELSEAPRFEEANQPEFDPSYRRRVIMFYRPR